MSIEYITLPDGRKEQILRPDNCVVTIGAVVKPKQQGGTTDAR